MTRDEAIRLVRAFFRAFGVESEGLNNNNLGGAVIGESQIYFEYLPETQTLKCSALIYKFHDQPKPGVIDSFQSDEADTGGGTVDYEVENKGLYLSRSYSEPVSVAEFVKDLKELMEASRGYGEVVLDRVASEILKG